VQAAEQIEADIRKKWDEYVTLHSLNSRGNLVEKSLFTYRLVALRQDMVALDSHHAEISSTLIALGNMLLQHATKATEGIGAPCSSISVPH
jgi:hypothetical protein